MNNIHDLGLHYGMWQGALCCIGSDLSGEITLRMQISFRPGGYIDKSECFHFVSPSLPVFLFHMGQRRQRLGTTRTSRHKAQRNKRDGECRRKLNERCNEIDYKSNLSFHRPSYYLLSKLVLLLLIQFIIQNLSACIDELLVGSSMLYYDGMYINTTVNILMLSS